MNKNKKFSKGRKVFSVPVILSAAAISATVAVAAITIPPGVTSPPGTYTIQPPLPTAGQTTGISIIAFPQRDFVTLSGYAQDDVVVVTVTHDPALYTLNNDGVTPIPPITTDPAGISPDSTDPNLPTGGNGMIQVNHPGGSCWNGTTPDIRAGDLIEADVIAGTNNGRKDATIVASITAKRPIIDPAGTGDILVHGTAETAPGSGVQIPVTSLEHRLIAPGNTFAKSGARTLRATNLGGNKIFGSVNYDAVGSINWTASYPGLNAADSDLALGSDSDGIWLGNATLPAVEATQYEVGAFIAPGPSVNCSAAPLEILPPPAGTELTPPSTPTGLSALFDGVNQVTLNWDPSIDPPSVPTASGVTGYGIFRSGQLIFTVSNIDGLPNPPVPTTYVDHIGVPGNYYYEVRAIDGAGNVSGYSDKSDNITISQLNIGNFPVNEPPKLPINIIAFPSRDFISPSGYLESDKVTVQVIRNGVIVSSADDLTPKDDGTGTFFAEVNHPGGACWAVQTPELREGDIVRTIAFNPAAKIDEVNPLGIRSIDQTHIAGVTTFRPVKITDETGPGSGGVVEIHGTALGADGKPIPLAQLEQRMVANRDAFDLTGRRTLRSGLAPGSTLVYDPVNAHTNPLGLNWTARYTGLSCDDVYRMMGGTCPATGTNFPGADTRIHWLGLNPLTLAEATIYENSTLSPPGPAAPQCTAVTSPLETPDSTAPTVPGNFKMTADSQSGSTATFTWDASSDDFYVAGYRIYQDGNPVADVGTSGLKPGGSILEFGGPIPTTYTLTGIPAGNHTYQITAYDTASALGVGADSVSQISAGFGVMYGNESAFGGAAGGGSNVVTRSQNDVTAPTVPINLVADVNPVNPANTTVYPITLTWTASTDDVGVTAYEVFRNGALFATVPSNTFSTTVPVPAKNTTVSYTYAVDAKDSAGNTSAQSASSTITVKDKFDNNPPSNPSNVTATVTNPDAISGRDVTLAWTPSTDNFGVTGYNVYRNGGAAPIATGIFTTNAAGKVTVTDPALPAGTYTYRVEAFDAAGNNSGLAPTTGTTPVIIANLIPANGHAVFAFPARDFISATGFNYAPVHNFHFELLRGAQKFTSGQWQNTPGDITGTVEVNHPGGACWNTTTPNIKPGDVVRIVDETTGIAEQTVVANVTAERQIASNANTIIIHGTAAKADGTPIPLGQVEARLIGSSASPFAINGKRVLRAGGAGQDGTLAYDPIGVANPQGIKWTATISGLSAADMVLAVAAESRALWLGNNPLALAEGTLFENGPGVTGGPAAAAPGGAVCPAPAESPQAAITVPVTPLSFANTKFLPVPAGTSAAQTVTISAQAAGVGAGSPVTVTNLYMSGLNPADFSRVAAPNAGTCSTALPFTLNPGASCTVRVQFSPKAAGNRQAELSFTSNATNTTDTSIPLSGLGLDNTAPTVGLSANPVAFGTINGGLVGTQNLVVRNTSTSPTGLVLNINSASISSTVGNPADFSITNNGCAGVALRPVSPDTCTIALQFSPGARAARTGTLVLAHTATGTGSVSTNVGLTGTGGAGAAITLTPNPVTYGSVTRSTTKTQVVNIQNTGNAATTGLAISTTSTPVVIGGITFNNFYSVQSNTCGASIAAGGRCSATVAFNAPNAVGPNFAGTLKVTTTNGVPATATTNLAAATK